MWLTALAWIVAGALSQVVASHAIRVMQAHSRDVHLSVVANYAAGAIVALGYAVLAGGTMVSGLAVLIGIATGVFYTAALLTIITSMGQRGLALTVAISGLALLIPTALSLAYGERLSSLQTLGIAMAVPAVPLLGLSTTTGDAVRERPSAMLAAVLFLLQGGAMCGNLLAHRHLAPESRPAFLVVLFASGTVFALLARMGRQRDGAPGDVRRGVWFGLTNVASTLTILAALTRLPGSLLFAAMGVVGLALSAVVAVALWHERLQAWGWCGLALATGAIVLLNSPR